MKMRRAMAIIAIVAVACWLAVPAIRIWRDPSTLRHVHQISSPPGKVTRVRFEPPIVVSTTIACEEGVQLTHDASFARRYWSLLLGRRWSDPSACSLRQAVFIEAVLDNPKPDRYGETLFKNVAALLFRTRSKATGSPSKED